MRRKKGFFTLVTSCEKIFCKNLPQNVQNRMVSIHIYYRGKVPEKNTPTRQNSACAALTTRNMSAVLGLDMPCQKLSLMFRSNYPPVDYRHSLYLFPQPPDGRPRSSGMLRPSRRGVNNLIMSKKLPLCHSDRCRNRRRPCCFTEAACLLRMLRL